MEVNAAFEILIGMVAPLGTEREWFIGELKEKFEARDYIVGFYAGRYEISHNILKTLFQPRM